MDTPQPLSSVPLPLLCMLAQIPDPRKARGRRHPWTALLLLLVVGLLCGANTQRAIARWARAQRRPTLQRLGFTAGRCPSQSTLQRLLARVDVVALERSVGQWLQTLARPPRQTGRAQRGALAIDGKTLRGAQRRGAAPSHLLAACSHHGTRVLGQVPCPATTNELGVVAALLDQLPLARVTCTFDALFTQVEVAQAVLARGGAYLLPAKGNQRTLRQACADATADRGHLPRPSRQLGQVHTTRLAHGRLEQRTLRVAEAPPDLGLPGAQQVLRLDRRILNKQTGQVQRQERVYAITSLPPTQATPAALLHLWQGHWTIENRLHWVRDVVFGEDAAGTHVGTAPEAFTTFRNLALALLHHWRGAQITAARAYCATHLGALFHHLHLPPQPPPS